MSQSMKALQAMLTEGISLTEASARFGVSKAAVSKAKLHPPKKRVAAQTIEQLTAIVRDLEEDAETYAKKDQANYELRQQLAASQLHAEQLREALSAAEETIDIVWVSHHANRCDRALELCRKALALPRDTSALDAYVEQKVKEIIESHAPEGRNVTNAQHVEMRHKFVDQIATLTRQRDLAVEALTILCQHNSSEPYVEVPSAWIASGRKILSAIKESEGK